MDDDRWNLLVVARILLVVANCVGFFTVLLCFKNALKRQSFLISAILWFNIAEC